MEEALIVLAALGILAAPILAIIALVISVKQRRRLSDVTQRLQVAESSLRALQAAPSPAAEPIVETPAPALSAEAETPPAAPAAPAPATPPDLQQDLAPERPPERPPETPAPPIPQAPTPQPIAAKVSAPPTTSGPSKGERALAERWMVWLGGLTLALGGAFLVKYSADQGLITPIIRTLLTALGGIAAMVLGHWLARRDQRAHESAQANASTPWFVPAALVGAGSAVVFASLFTGYAYYDMMPPTLAFAALALTAAVTALLATRHGSFVALLGLAGGYVVPALVSTNDPSLVALLSYLLLITAGAVALLRWMGWRWLAWVVLGAVTVWTLTAQVVVYQAGDESLIGIFLVAVFGLFALLRLGLPLVPSLAGRDQGRMSCALVYITGSLLALLMLFTLWIADYSTAAWVMAFALSAAFMALGARDPALNRLPWISALLAVFGLLGWDLGVIDPENLDSLLAFTLPEQSATFAWVAALYGLLHLVAGLGLAGALTQRAAPRPWHWAAIACAMPLMMLATAYSRLAPLVVDMGWSLGSLALGGLMLALATRCARSDDQDPAYPGASFSRRDALLVTYASGLLAALALAATFVLRDAWLTVALALLPLGMGWISRAVPVDGLRKVALLIVGIVLVRLVFNPYALDYASSDDPSLPWIFYGYGLPALSFALASVLFRRQRDDLLVSALEGSAVLFAVVMVLRWIHLAFTGSSAPEEAWIYSFAEQSLQTDAVLAGAGLMFLLYRRNQRAIPLFAGHIMATLGSLHLLLGQMLANTPYGSGIPVGENLLINDLALAYGMPALILAALFRLAPPLPLLAKAPALPGKVYGGLGLLSAILWATLEIRQAFSPNLLDLAPVGESELWAYSALYLLIGVAILLAGIRSGQGLLRKAGLVVVLGVVAKVFLVDLSQTEGLWRALSFLALGACLVGLGLVYRRIVAADDGPQA